MADGRCKGAMRIDKDPERVPLLEQKSLGGLLSNLLDQIRLYSALLTIEFICTRSASDGT